MSLGLRLSLSSSRPLAAPIDSDVTNFLQYTNITDPIIIDALNVFVLSLKANSWWDPFDVIYPFVGSETQQSFNLKSPSSYQITWNGVITFDVNGATFATGYGDTGYLQGDADNFGGVTYLRSITGITGCLLGSNSAAPSNTTLQLGGDGLNVTGIVSTEDGFISTAWNNIKTAIILYSPNGDGLSVYSSFSGAETDTGATISDNTTFPFFLMAQNQGGSPTNVCVGNMALAMIGRSIPVSNCDGLDTVIQIFQTALSRAV